MKVHVIVRTPTKLEADVFLHIVFPHLLVLIRMTHQREQDLLGHFLQRKERLKLNFKLNKFSDTFQWIALLHIQLLIARICSNPVSSPCRNSQEQSEPLTSMCGLITFQVTECETAVFRKLMARCSTRSDTKLP